MSLKRKLNFVASSPDGYTITIQDTTGDYNAQTNTGGYGSPNLARTDFVSVMIIMSYLQYRGHERIGSIFNIVNPANLLSGEPFELNYSLSVDFQTGKTVFLDGVAELMSYALTAFDTEITGTAGDKFIIGTDLSAVLVAGYIVSNDGLVYEVDTTAPNSTTMVYLTYSLLSDLTSARVAYKADCFSMVTAELSCSLADAAVMSAEADPDERITGVALDVLAKRFAADFQFALGKFKPANDAILTGLTQMRRLYHG